MILFIKLDIRWKMLEMYSWAVYDAVYDITVILDHQNLAVDIIFSIVIRFGPGDMMQNSSFGYGGKCNGVI